MISNKFLGQDLHIQHDEDSCREKLLNEQYDQMIGVIHVYTVNVLSSVCACILGESVFPKNMCFSSTFFFGKMAPS